MILLRTLSFETDLVYNPKPMAWRRWFSSRHVIIIIFSMCITAVKRICHFRHFFTQEKRNTIALLSFDSVHYRFEFMLLSIKNLILKYVTEIMEVFRKIKTFVFCYLGKLICITRNNTILQ